MARSHAAKKARVVGWVALLCGSFSRESLRSSFGGPDCTYVNARAQRGLTPAESDFTTRLIWSRAQGRACPTSQHPRHRFSIVVIELRHLFHIIVIGFRTCSSAPQHCHRLHNMVIDFTTLLSAPHHCHQLHNIVNDIMFLAVHGLPVSAPSQRDDVVS